MKNRLIDGIFVSLAGSSGFPAQELSRLLGMVEANQETFVEAWNGFFGF